MICHDLLRWMQVGHQAFNYEFWKPICRVSPVVARSGPGLVINVIEFDVSVNGRELMQGEGGWMSTRP